MQSLNYPGTSYRDVITFSFTTNSGHAGLLIPNGDNNVVMFVQPSPCTIVYVAISYYFTSTNPTCTISLHDVSGIAFNATGGGTSICSSVFSLTGDGTTNNIIYTVNTNTSALTPAGPYSSNSDRTIALRINPSANNTFYILSAVIGYGSTIA